MAGQQSHFEINVSERYVHDDNAQSVRYRHLFATAERSVVTDKDLERVLPEILAAFPEARGYKVEVTYWKTEGRTEVWRPEAPPAQAPARALRRAYAGRRGGPGRPGR